MFQLPQRRVYVAAAAARLLRILNVFGPAAVMNTKSTSSSLFLVATGAAVLAISVQYVDSVMVGYVGAANGWNAGQTLTYAVLCRIVLRKVALAFVALGSYGYLVKPSPLLTGIRDVIGAAPHACRHLTPPLPPPPCCTSQPNLQ